MARKPKIQARNKLGKLERQAEEQVSSFVHGALASLHGIALYYNIKHKKPIHAMIHGGILLYDLVASYRHYKASKNE